MPTQQSSKAGQRDVSDLSSSGGVSISPQRITSSQAKLSLFEAQLYEIHSNSPGEKVEISKEDLFTLIQKVSDVKAELLEFIREL